MIVEMGRLLNTYQSKISPDYVQTGMPGYMA